MLILLAAFAIACGDNHDDTSPPDAGTATSAVAYAIMVRTPDGFIEYLVADDGVPTGAPDLARARELTGGNYYPTDDAIYYGNFERATLQRYVVRPDLSIELAGELSFAQYGITVLNAPPVFFSAQRAYYVDAAAARIIVFDPTAMAITGEVAVPELQRNGYVGYFMYAQRVGDRFFGTVTYDTADYSQTAPDSTVAVLLDDDPARPVTVLRDARAATAASAFVDDAGTLYVLADATGGWLPITGIQALPSPKLLRIAAGASGLDPDYALDLGALLDARGANGLWPVGGTRFVVQAWPNAVDPAAVLATPDDFWLAPYFEWYLVDAADRSFARIGDLAASPQSVWRLPMTVDGATYIQQYRYGATEQDNAVELFRVGADGAAVPVAETSRGDFRMLTRVAVTP